MTRPPDRPLEYNEATLQDMLDARESRAALQKELLIKYRAPLLCFTLNIAGPMKRSRIIDFAFERALIEIRARLRHCMLEERLTYAVSGPEAMWACALDAAELKRCAVSLEEEKPVGRLYDLDVLNADGSHLSRGAERGCIVCGGPVTLCSRSRAHGLAAVQSAANKLLCDYATDELAALAVAALVDEVDLTPKPGLVDSANNGAHADMDRAMFHRSARCLAPYFKEAVRIGVQGGPLPSLREAGRDAERIMLAETCGVNTHKGAIYSLGLLLFALGRTLSQGGDVFDTVKSSALALLALETAPTQPPAGARGEALTGFKNAQMAAQALLESGGNALYALTKLFATVEDTNLLRRGGKSGLAFVQGSAKELLNGPIELLPRGLASLDTECIRRGLSPGGSADILAAALLLNETRAVWQGRAKE